MSSQFKHYKVRLQYYKYDTHVVLIRFQSNGWNGNVRFNSRISIGVIGLIIGGILPHGYMSSMFSNSSKTCESGSSSAGSWSTGSSDERWLRCNLAGMKSSSS